MISTSRSVRRNGTSGLFEAGLAPDQIMTLLYLRACPDRYPIGSERFSEILLGEHPRKGSELAQTLALWWVDEGTPGQHPVQLYLVGRIR